MWHKLCHIRFGGSRYSWKTVATDWKIPLNHQFEYGRWKWPLFIMCQKTWFMVKMAGVESIWRVGACNFVLISSFAMWNELRNWCFNKHNRSNFLHILKHSWYTVSSMFTKYPYSHCSTKTVSNSISFQEFFFRKWSFYIKISTFKYAKMGIFSQNS